MVPWRMEFIGSVRHDYRGLRSDGRCIVVTSLPLIFHVYIQIWTIPSTFSILSWFLVYFLNHFLVLSPQFLFWKRESGWRSVLITPWSNFHKRADATGMRSKTEVPCDVRCGKTKFPVYIWIVLQWSLVTSTKYWWLIDWLIGCIVFYAVSAIFQPCNGGVLMY